jgi:hypothetical protein
MTNSDGHAYQVDLQLADHIKAKDWLGGCLQLVLHHDRVFHHSRKTGSGRAIFRESRPADDLVHARGFNL